MTEPSVEEIVARIESPHESIRSSIRVMHLRLLAADWRKRGEALEQAELDMVAALANHEACRDIWVARAAADEYGVGLAAAARGLTVIKDLG